MNEQNKKHQKIKKTLKIVGILLIIVGATLTIIGIGNFFSSFGSGEMPQLFFLAFIGLPTLAVGASVTIFAFKKEITTYVKNESVPIINQTANEISPAIQTITETVKDSLQNTDKENLVCTCGTINSPDSKFCKNCGKSLIKQCPRCGAKLSADSNFCDHCGVKLDK